MTTIILTIIGILLAAIAALMVIFYGGDAFSSSSTGALANTLQNAGTNVISAANLYRAENGTQAANLAALAPRYLKDVPAVSNAGTTPAFDGATGFFTVQGVADTVCDKINENLGVPLDNEVGDHKMGCDKGETADASVFYAVA